MSDITQKWVNVLEPYTRDYSLRLSASQIAKEVKMPQQTVSRILNKLASKNLVEFVRQGRNKLFYLNLEKETSKLLILSVETNKAIDFLTNSRIAHIIEELSSLCEGLILFGSHASGKQTKNSDIDLVILGKSDKKAIHLLKRKQVLEINLHDLTFLELKSSLNKKNPLAIEIKNNHIFFGNTSKMVDVFLRCGHGR